MKMICVVAHGKNLEIGFNNKLLWHIPEDLKQFKKITMGKTLLMGRKTFESIGRVLPGRSTVVITRNKNWNYPEVATFASIHLAIEYYKKAKLPELLIVGGGEIYKQALPLCREIWATEVDYLGDADTYFPSYSSDFREIEKIELTSKAQFKVFQRIKSGV